MMLSTTMVKEHRSCGTHKSGFGKTPLLLFDYTSKIGRTLIHPLITSPTALLKWRGFVPYTYCFTWAWVWDGGSEGKETTFIWSI